jgi:hypothetical protein
MDAEDPNLLTAIVSTALAGTTFAAAQVGFNGAIISYLDPSVVARTFHDHARQLVANNPRVGIDGMAARKGVKVASADAYSLHVN